MKMILIEVKKKRYGAWSGGCGAAFDPAQCAAEVRDWNGWSTVQCSRKPVAGPENLYCKQHAKKHERREKPAVLTPNTPLT